MAGVINRVPRAWMPSGGTGGGYTELFDSFNPSAEGVWTSYDLATNHSIPKGAVVNMVAFTIDQVSVNAGLRASGSSIDRQLYIGSYYSSIGWMGGRFITTCDISTGNIEYFTDDLNNITFVILGYWEGVTWSEMLDVVLIDSAEDNMWTTKAISVPANAVCDVALTNNANYSRWIGVRGGGSSLNRSFETNNVYRAGDSINSMFAKANASSQIDVFLEVYNQNYAYVMGYFDDTVDFIESFDDITPSSDNTWEEKDLSSYVTDPKQVDLLLMGWDGLDVGARENATLLDRKVTQGSGNSQDFPTGAPFTCNVDNANKVQLYSSNSAKSLFKYTGQFHDPQIIGNGFTDIMEPLNFTATGWQVQTVSNIFPPNSVLEIQLRNKNTSGQSLGVRETGSSLDRVITIGRTYDSGINSNIKMFVNLDSNRQFEIYADITTGVDFLITGCWVGVTFTEKLAEIHASNSGEVGVWIASNTLSSPYSGTPNAIATMCVANDANAGYTCGVRSIGSSIDRRLLMGNAVEGAKGFPCCVKLDNNGNFEGYFENYTTNVLYYLGELTSIDYVEMLEVLPLPSNINTWTDLDISSYLDQNGRIVDIIGRTRVASGNVIGFRSKGNAQSRMTNINTDNTSNFWGWGCNITSDSNGLVQSYVEELSAGNTELHLLGYFK